MAVAFHWEPWRRHAAKRPTSAAKSRDLFARTQRQERAELVIGIVTLSLAVLAGLALPWL